jgi:hypothetical protein
LVQCSLAHTSVYALGLAGNRGITDYGIDSFKFIIKTLDIFKYLITNTYLCVRTGITD